MREPSIGISAATRSGCVAAYMIATSAPADCPTMTKGCSSSSAAITPSSTPTRSSNVRGSSGALLLTACAQPVVRADRRDFGDRHDQRWCERRRAPRVTAGFEDHSRSSLAGAMEPDGQSVELHDAVPIACRWASCCGEGLSVRRAVGCPRSTPSAATVATTTAPTKRAAQSDHACPSTPRMELPTVTRRRRPPRAIPRAVWRNPGQAAAASDAATATASAPAAASTVTAPPSTSAPLTNSSAMRSSTSRWMSRRSGRAPYSGS